MKTNIHDAVAVAPVAVAAAVAALVVAVVALVVAAVAASTFPIAAVEHHECCWWFAGLALGSAAAATALHFDEFAAIIVGFAVATAGVGSHPESHPAVGGQPTADFAERPIGAGFALVEIDQNHY